MSLYYQWDECVDDVVEDPEEISEYEDRATEDAIERRKEREMEASNEPR
jgi:hypothetical protein